MLLRWVELRDFRNHAHTKLKPIPEGLLVAVGANGEGKTNLLEGMHFLYALQSPRASASEPLVRLGRAFHLAQLLHNIRVTVVEEAAGCRNRRW